MPFVAYFLILIQVNKVYALRLESRCENIKHLKLFSSFFTVRTDFSKY